MEYFDMRKMSVDLWRNAAGETREICRFPPAKRDFYWRASIASIATNGEFSLFPGMERSVTLLEGGEICLESTDRFSHTLKPLQPFAFSADQVVKAKLTEGLMSMDFNVMTRLDICKMEHFQYFEFIQFFPFSKISPKLFPKTEDSHFTVFFRRESLIFKAASIFPLIVLYEQRASLVVSDKI